MNKNSSSFQSTNPATGKILWQGKEAGAKEISLAVCAARHAFFSWSTLPVERRKEYLIRFKERLSVEKESFAIAISEETGKPLWESLLEVDAMIAKVEISFRAYEERCREVKREKNGAVSVTRFKPHGVLAVLGPFNLPGHLPNGHMIPALLAGNTVVFKPSEYTPLVGERLVKLWQSAQIPSGVLNLIQGAGKTGASLVSHKELDGVLFTGSARAGKAIHQVFSGNPRKILALEMGGNNPLVVGQVSDIRAAVYMTLQSAYLTSGQRCVCARRLVICESSKSKLFLKLLIETAQKLRVGFYTDRPEPFMGPLISPAAAKKCLDAQKNLVHLGGKILLPCTSLRGLAAKQPGRSNLDSEIASAKLLADKSVLAVKTRPVPRNDAFLTPGIIDVTRVLNRPDEEIFGPILQVIQVPNFDKAIEIANQTAYGLAAGLLSDDQKEYQNFFRHSIAGVINWNQPLTGANSEAPFGGVGQSGNHHPSAYFAADYAAYPVASMEKEKLVLPERLTPGIEV